MSAKNPTVSIQVTERELRLLMDRFDYSSRYVGLREKLYAAHEDMRKAKTLKNRAAKLARVAKSGVAP